MSVRLEDGGETDCPGCTRLRAELDAAREQLAALSQWQCKTCGARFGDKVFPAVELDGVTRCTRCVEVEVLGEQLAAARREMVEKFRQLSKEWREDAGKEHRKDEWSEAIAATLCDCARDIEELAKALATPPADAAKGECNDAE